MGYCANFLENLNFMLFVQISILVLATLLKILSGSSDRLLILSDRAMKAAFFLAVFNAFNAGFSITTNIRMGSDESLFVANLLLGLVSVGALFYHLQNHRRCLDEFDVRDVVFNPSRAGKLYWMIFVGFKFVLALTIGLVSSSFGVASVFFLQLFFLVSVLLSPPYSITLQNVRMFLNETAAAFVLLVIWLYNMEAIESLTILLVCGWLVLGCMLFSVGMLTYSIFMVFERVTHRNLAMT